MADEQKKKRAPRERDQRFKGQFTDRWVASTKGYEKEVQYAERLKKGRSLMLYVSPSDAKVWRVLYYDKGKPRSERLGVYPELKVAAAREEALEFRVKTAIASGKAGLFKKVADDWFADHVEKQGLISAPEIKRHLATYILPELGHRPIFKIERDEISDLLRKIENKKISYSVEGKKRKNKKRKFVGGRSQADAVLSTIRLIMSWYEGENGKFESVIVKSLRRDKRKAREKKRTRTLDFDEIKEEGGEIRLEWNDRGEIRAVWTACDDMGIYGGLVKLLLLTAQRREKVAEMKWSDLSPDGVWTMRSSRSTGNPKGTPGKIKLPQIALDILDKLPRIAGNDHVFPAIKRKNRNFDSFSEKKRELNQKLPKDMRPWRLHDLRRTASSLMAKAGVADHIAERTLGHAIPGVAGTYNRYDYTPEKNAALQTLANQIAAILNPPDETNVIPLRQSPQ